MIKGIGIDILEIQRIQKSVATFGNDFLEKIFTSAEIRYCTAKHNAAQHFAARFAAKEAVSKAFATGWRGNFSWKDIEVTNDELGKPYIALSGKLKETLAHASIFVSLSHSESHVVAMVVLEED
ncbi:MAG TPA: holo-[acyl-carrier-protein] synthase [Bacteroidetes bacterium]|jgi:holo-[acyl-carrier protein] synthase|nr:holo-[acyl-carrier-protein] synthase [Bacteroidota bacterium]